MTRKPPSHQAERFMPATINEDPQKLQARYGTVEETPPERPEPALEGEVQMPFRHSSRFGNRQVQEADPYDSSNAPYNGSSVRFNGTQSWVISLPSEAPNVAQTRSQRLLDRNYPLGRSTTHFQRRAQPNVQAGPEKITSAEQGKFRTTVAMAKVAATAAEEVNQDEDTQQVQQEVLQTYSYFRAVKNGAAAIRNAAQSAGQSIRAVGGAAVSGTKAVITGASAAAAAPVIPIILIVLFLMMLLLGPLILFSGVTVKSDPGDLNAAYLYITQLDAEMERRIRQTHRADMDTVYLVNSRETSYDSIRIQTDADYLLLYLDTVYENLELSRSIDGAFGGQTVRDEIAAIHSQLYSYTTQVITEEVEDGPDSDPVTITWQEVDITVRSVDLFLAGADVISADNRVIMDAASEFGAYAAMTSLADPFDSSYYVKSRWGWYVDDHDRIQQRLGVLLMPLAGGSYTVYSCSAGTVDSVTPTSVTVIDSTGTVYYGQLTYVSVRAGQELSTGTLIGTVDPDQGLELQYNRDGVVVNPVFYLPQTGTIAN